MEIECKCRLAQEKDLDHLVRMLADDVLGKKRERYEQPLPIGYKTAFQAITTDPNNELLVACYQEGEPIGMAQITYTPLLTHQGGWRATIEGVRTSASERGKGVGRKLMESAIDRAQKRKCHLVQLTSDKQRADAKRFYERLGFEATHEGFKLRI